MNIINLLVYLCEMCSTIFMMSSLFLYDVVHPGNHQPLKAGHWLLMWCWRHEWKHRCCYSIRKFCIFLANHSTGSGSFTISSFVCPSSIHFLETNSVEHGLVDLTCSFQIFNQFIYQVHFKKLLHYGDKDSIWQLVII